MIQELNNTLAFLRDAFRARLADHFGQENAWPLPPLPIATVGPFARFVQEHRLSTDEFLVLAIGLAPHLDSTFFDKLVQAFLPKGGDLPEFGGVRSPSSRIFLPTGETALFLLAGDDLGKRLAAQRIFSPDHFFAQKKTLWVEEVPSGEPLMSGKIVLAPELVEFFSTGQHSRPRFGLHFPADLVETSMEWDDLVLPAATLQHVEELLIWVRHGQSLLRDYGMAKRLKPGYRALFWGPPGTGKTLTAGLIGKQTGRDVYKIDLSMVVSKFIGETEKNLASLFDRAENKDWILFFDEADALFGKRTNVRDAHDKYANQEVSYLLQRVEHFSGLVILASNFKSNMDDAFVRRFQSIIHFPMPKANERLLLWEKALPEKLYQNGINLGHLARNYELTGATILNAVQFAALQVLERGGQQLEEKDLHAAINRELGKEGKMVG